MRQLTAKQKKLLNQIMLDNEPSQDDKIILNESNPIESVATLPSDVVADLEQINDTEILWQEVDRYIYDWRLVTTNN